MAAIPREFSESRKRVKALLVLSQFKCKEGKNSFQDDVFT